MAASFALVFAALVASSLAEIIVDRPNENNLNRPCEDSDNSLSCIRDVFQSNGWCRRVPRVNPEDPYVLRNLVSEIPSVNVTAQDNRLSIEGLNQGYVYDFFINPNTDTAVLTVQFRDLDINGDSNYDYHRDGKEDVRVTAKDTTSNYPLLRITTTSSGANKFTENNSQTTTNIQRLPKIVFPGIEDVQDQEIQNLFRQVFANLRVVVEELFVSRGPKLSNFYINHIICGSA